MRFWKILRQIGLIIALTLLPHNLEAQTLSLNFDKLCKVWFQGKVLSQGRIFGSRESLLLNLNEGAGLRTSILRVHSCAYETIKLAGRPDLTEVEWIIENFAEPSAVELPEHLDVLIERMAPQEFAMAVGGLPPGRGTVQGNLEPPDISSGLDEAEACGQVSEICVDRDGTVSAQIKCGPAVVGLASDGGLTLGVGAGPFGINVSPQ